MSTRAAGATTEWIRTQPTWMQRQPVGGTATRVYLLCDEADIWALVKGEVSADLQAQAARLVTAIGLLEKPPEGPR